MPRPLARADFVMRRDKDNRNGVAAAREPFLGFQTVHARHLHIQNRAVSVKRRHRVDTVQKLLPRREGLSVHAEGANESFQSSTDRNGIIDDRDQWQAFGH